MNPSNSLGLGRTGLVGVAHGSHRPVVVAPLSTVMASPVVKASRAQHVLAGYSSTRIIMEFTRWAVERSEFPTVEAIVRRFSVSRATAYRWRNELGETYGLLKLPPNEGARCNGALETAEEADR